MKSCKSILMISTAFLLAACGGNAGKDEPDPEPVPEIMTAKPTVKKDQSISSSVLGMSIKYSVWLPPTYDPAKSYPVLYLLHGYEFDTTDAHNKWLSTASGWGGSPDGGNLSSIATKYVRDGGELFIIVTPNGQNAFYMDDFDDRKLKYGTFFIDEFIPHIEKQFKGNGKRAIAGLSMGGNGTLYQGLGHPEMFTYMYAMSPATFRLDEVLEKADKSKVPPITIETGTEDGTVSLSSVQAFVNKLKDKEIPCEFITRSGGHTWQFWQECLPKALKKVGESFK